MWGAIIGDIVGSIYEVYEVEEMNNSGKRSYEERIKILDAKTPLFTSESSYTDDTALTVAIADAIMNDCNYEYYLRLYGKKEVNIGLDKYGRSRFSRSFCKWLESEDYGKSDGNGSAMRVGPIGFHFDSLNKVIKEARLSAKPTHNQNEPIEAAAAVAATIFLARTVKNKDYIKEYISNEFNYNLDLDLNNLQHENEFSSKAIDTVPLAIYCFLISSDFEDGIRKSISIGGDSDTIAAITGSILEAYYGIPNELKIVASKYLKEEQLLIVQKFYEDYIK